MTRELLIKPPWTMTNYSFNKSKAYYNKKETSNHTYKNVFHELINKLPDHIHIYTDVMTTDREIHLTMSLLNENCISTETWEK